MKYNNKQHSSVYFPYHQNIQSKGKRISIVHFICFSKTGTGKKRYGFSSNFSFVFNQSTVRYEPVPNPNPREDLIRDVSAVPLQLIDGQCVVSGDVIQNARVGQLIEVKFLTEPHPEAERFYSEAI